MSKVDIIKMSTQVYNKIMDVVSFWSFFQFIVQRGHYLMMCHFECLYLFLIRRWLFSSRFLTFYQWFLENGEKNVEINEIHGRFSWKIEILDFIFDFHKMYLLNIP